MCGLASAGSVDLKFISPKFTYLKIMAGFTALILFAVLISCGGGKSSSSSMPAAPTPNVAGAWEFIAVSDNGSVTGVEVALNEAQVLVNGLEQPNGQITANGNQIAFVNLQSVGQVFSATGFGGLCTAATTTPTYSLGPGAVTAIDAPFNFSFTENGAVFNVTGTLGGDGQSLVNGAYTPQSTSPCTNAAGAVTDPGGTITGTVVAKLLSVPYSGKMCPVANSVADPAQNCAAQSDFTDTVTATVSESSSAKLTLNLVITNASGSTNFTMTGVVTGNAFTASGTYALLGGSALVTYYGYYEVVGGTPTLYFVNASDPTVAIGTLAGS